MSMDTNKVTLWSRRIIYLYINICIQLLYIHIELFYIYTQTNIFKYTYIPIW